MGVGSGRSPPPLLPAASSTFFVVETLNLPSECVYESKADAITQCVFREYTQC
jgi:hypothetical protein